ncbi:class III poly(R)-hydroxyalkanoic acid synthase subunit PhaE [Luteimonas sp. BDR2-5]|uniref:class III poly(R)-hydroxyalkanoic acid synthase subunit PhaE n=1 Tax=Proluteimonas luteida TaxID=2878685 RepID=UPI001E2BCE4F|nr:class III poly(R)-hydroxyalkanoic acid synthase subunit PhaE [Luteimonas sp. BDR2-5]MCD9028161.1 class III poly(R)-hydroxyalkanoic acid synthase subunit PhaE [Luteimonas sp. BDR2-5]
MANGWQGVPGISGTELERLARQAWDAWGQALRQTAPGAAAGAGGFGLPGAVPGFGTAAADPWRDAMDWWARHAAPPGQPAAGDVVDRFNAQARQWFAEMQRLAMQFAERSASPQDIAGAWRQALGGAQANPFAQMFDGLQGMAGPDAWMAHLRPFLDAVNGGQRDWLQMPAFGVAREHQERWQALALAQTDYQRSQQAYHALLARASQAAFVIFERKLEAHATPGRQIESPRALFDLWIDAAEEAYAEIALSLEFRSAYADMVNGQMRLRLAVQKEIEQACRLFDLPTRSELDGAHRKIAELERALRRLSARVDEVAPRTTRRGAAGVAATAAPATPQARGDGPAADDVTATKATAQRRATPAPAAAGAGASTGAAAPAAKKRAAKTTGKAAKKTAKKTVARTATKTAKQASGKVAAPARKAPKKTAGKVAAPQRAAPAAPTRANPSPAKGRGKRTAAASKATATRTAARRTPRAVPATRAAARKAARAPSRVERLPNYGFISPIPLAPEPLNDVPAGRVRSKKKR